MNPIRIVLIMLGFLSLGLGTLGAFLPVLPTVPLYLLAAALFAKSSTKLHQWFTNTKIYKQYLESYAAGEGMTLQTKRKITLTITVSMLLGAVLTLEVPAVKWILLTVWLCLMGYFFLIVETKTE